MQLYDLKTLHMKAALGIDRVPYFSWKMCSDKENVLQTGYQIIVTNDQKECLWDSGKVDGRKQSFVEYEGKELASKTAYRWNLLVWNNYDEVARAEGQFETALLRSDEWQAKWVESTIERPPITQFGYGNTPPAVFFEKKFVLKETVKKARLYATCYGVYRLRMNEKRPDDREFAPEFTVYEDILYYQTYDVTKLLKKGDNTLDMYVGDGWYFSMQAGPVTDHPHEKPSVLFQLEVEYENGETEMIVSDGSETCSLGPICFSDVFQGEKQDYTIGFEPKYPVAVRDYSYDILRAQPMPPVRPVKEIPAVEVFTTPEGDRIVDFGQVMAGKARIHIDVPKGTEVAFEYFEILDEKGNYINTMFSPQKDIVVSNGEPIDHEVFFTFHGFRYIRVTGIEEVKPEDFVALLLTTEKENVGSFECSDKRLNRLYQNIRWSQYNNMMSIPTDCPGREKAGFTGDILIYAKTALMNEDVTPFLSSWLTNVGKNQDEDGTVMIVTPYTKLYHRVISEAASKFGDEKETGVAGWSDAIVWVPYEMYRVTGNTVVLREQYEPMRKWVEYIIKTAEEKRGYHNIPEEYDRYLWNTGFHFGEWLVPSRPDNTGEQYGICKESAFYIAPYIGYQTIVKMAEICRILGKEQEGERYAQIAEKMKEAIQQGLFYADKLPNYLMGAYVLAFAFDLVPDDLYEEYKARLLALIEEHDNCLDTGFLATPYILDALCKIGEAEKAHDILWQDKRPSWLYEVDHGATSIWEAWDADDARSTKRVVSFDHYAFGCVDDWICRKIAGIDSDTPGFSHIIIHPEADERITSCRRTFESEAGTVEVSWNEKELQVSIPCNTTATVVWKGKTTELGSGRYVL